MFDIELAKKEIKKIAEKHQLALVVLFGSQASGKIHAKSDADLAFTSRKKISLMDIAKMQTELSKKLKFEKIDLIDLKDAGPLLLKQIALKSVILYENEPSLFAQFKIYALKRFMEAKKLLALREASLDKFLQKI